jgi:methylated-DNA-protein-cysteine methyltransferase related protein
MTPNHGPGRAGQPKPRAASPRAQQAERDDFAAPDDASARIYAVVRTVPRGKVVTYGQLALLAGIARGHRVAARALQSCPAELPWQRVVAKHDARRARISIQDPQHATLQRQLLEAEGVVFDEQGLIGLRASGWLPGEHGVTARRRGPG